MNLEQMLPILTQLPIVALFIWYSERLYKQFMEFLKEEREARRIQAEAMARELKEESEARRMQNEVMTKELSEFHHEFTSAVQVMKDRTARDRKNPN